MNNFMIKSISTIAINWLPCRKIKEEVKKYNKDGKQAFPKMR